MEGKKFAVLLCTVDREFMKKKYGGYFGVFVNMLAEEGESWHVFNVLNSELPEDDEVAGYDGFVLTGSARDAHGDDVWISNLMIFLKKLDSMKKRVLGICFGHQILARALGGRTGRSSSGLDVGVTKVQLVPSQLFTSLNLPNSLHIIEFHRDEVEELPPKAEVLGWSNNCSIEMFRYGDHIMGIQGHPEYTKDILLNLINVAVRRNYLKESLAAKAKAKLEGREPDSEAWKKLCTSFLKSRL